MNPDQALTVPQVAEILKLNAQTVTNWIDHGSLRAIRVGRRVRVYWGDVEAMMKPAGPAIQGSGSSGNSSDAQSFWDGDYVPLAGLEP